MRYYRLSDEINYPERWYLGDITEDDWLFVNGQKVNEGQFGVNICIDLYQDGEPMDYTTNEAYSVPIVSQRIRNQLAGVQSLQFIPVKINGKEVNSTYFIMVVTSKKNCVNEELSEFGKFVENDPIRPDLAGQYSWFSKLVIDRGKINGEEVFRVDKAANYLIVSERIKEAIEEINSTGVKFTEV
jgi:hypothetical protein